MKCYSAVPGLLLSLLAAAGPAAAGSFQVSPTVLEFDADTRTGVIVLRNTGDADLSIQAGAKAWSLSDDGSDVYEDTREVIAVPPLFTISPGEQQLVRVGLVGAAPATVERAYRMVFTEILDPAAKSSGGLSFRLRMTLPVYSAPVRAIPRPELVLEDYGYDNDRFWVLLKNPGNTRVRLTELAASPAGEDQAKSDRVPAIVLAGARRRFEIESPGTGAFARLRAVTDNAGIREYELAATSK